MTTMMYVFTLINGVAFTKWGWGHRIKGQGSKDRFKAGGVDVKYYTIQSNIKLQIQLFIFWWLHPVRIIVRNNVWQITSTNTWPKPQKFSKRASDYSYPVGEPCRWTLFIHHIVSCILQAKWPNTNVCRNNASLNLNLEFVFWIKTFLITMYELDFYIQMKMIKT